MGRLSDDQHKKIYVVSRRVTDPVNYYGEMARTICVTSTVRVLETADSGKLP